MKRALFLALVGSALATTGALADATFSQADTDSDGFVSLDEAVTTQVNLTKAEFEQADANDDGKLTAEEYSRAGAS